MGTMELVDNELHLTLRKLIDEKSKRDAGFTLYRLAKAINMPYSILLRLTHPDPNKRVKNPRIDTLTKIVSFFQSEGFEISIDDLLTGIKEKTVDVRSQGIGIFTIEKCISVYSFNSEQEEKLNDVTLRLASNAQHVIALLSDEYIKPMFKKGSLFILDKDLKPANGMLLAVKLKGQEKISIRKLCVQNNRNILLSYDDDVEPIVLTPKTQCTILGVVIQVNAKT